MNSCKVKNITENNISSSEKEFKLTFETPDKTDTIQLSGEGVIKVTVPV